MAEKRVRVQVRLSEELVERIDYWAKKKHWTRNEWVTWAIEEGIQKQYSGFDLESMESARLNQLIEAVVTLSSNVESLENITIDGFDSLLGLTRGDNYLLEDESGEL